MNSRWLWGAAASTVISVAGWRLKALTSRGAVAAIGVGTGIAGGTSWPGVALLGTFFVSSSVLSRSNGRTDVSAKGSQRDEKQVIANGGIAALGSLIAGGGDQTFAIAVTAGALSAATADTWATEIGTRSKKIPHLVLSGRAVPRGTSGAVSLQGSLASLGGAMTIASIATVLVGTRVGWSRALLAGTGVAIGGMAGSLADSILGELVQERRHCPTCDVATESVIHRCGTRSVHTGGISGLDNDVVNLVCTIVGSLVVIPFVHR